MPTYIGDWFISLLKIILNQLLLFKHLLYFFFIMLLQATRFNRIAYVRLPAHIGLLFALLIQPEYR